MFYEEKNKKYNSSGTVRRILGMSLWAAGDEASWIWQQNFKKKKKRNTAQENAYKQAARIYEAQRFALNMLHAVIRINSIYRTFL